MISINKAIQKEFSEKKKKPTEAEKRRLIWEHKNLREKPGEIR